MASSRFGRTVEPMLVFAVALSLRAGIVLASRGGPSGILGYDPGVYYAAADALIHGRVPYADFVLLHPPALMLVLTPFAALGWVTTDHTGFIVANAAFAVLGAVNAVLIRQIAHTIGLSRAAALLGGLFYAVWWGAVDAEISVRLEPLGSSAFLCGLLAMVEANARPGSRQHRQLLVAAGAAWGLAVSTKIWWVVPVAVVFGWRLRDRATRPRIGHMLAGVAMLAAVIDLPFFIAAPRAMWRMVVLDQLGRHVMTSSRLTRLAELSSLHAAPWTMSHPAQQLMVAAFLALLFLVVVAAWRISSCRLFVLIFAAQLLVLLIAPVFFTFYPGYVAASASLVVAAAGERHRAFWPAGLSVATAAVATATAFSFHLKHVSEPFPDQLAAGLRSSRCVMADSPMALIELDVLSRNLSDGCPNWVDVSGRTYDVDRPPGKHWVSRPRNSRWQHDVRHYLLSGDAVIVIRDAAGLDANTLRAVDDHPVLEAADGYVVYRVRDSAHRTR
jgi:alpha-1,2-mannosyltransferase